MSRQDFGYFKAISEQTGAFERPLAPLCKTLALTLFASLSMACSSQDDADTSNPGGPNTTPQGSCGLNTGYERDDLCLPAPDPSDGFQLHYGPKDYSAAEVAKFLIHPGEETTDCLFLKTPNDTEVYIDEYHGRMRPGSHHMITYTQGTAHADSVVPEECSQGLDSRFLLGAQEPVIDITRKSGAPEEADHALKLMPKLQAVIQVHYVNTTQKPLLKEAWINVGYTPKETVNVLIEPIFWLGGLGARIPPRSQVVTKAGCDVGADVPSDLRLLQVTGHYHAHTTRFTAWKIDGETKERTRIYESYDYKDPGFVYFNSQKINPVPDAATGGFGGDHNGRLLLKTGDRVEWECVVDNVSDKELTFGNKVYEAEMCNMFGSYAPSMGTTWSCATF